ncbi:hypothetical protein [Solibacillus sp. FSL H8-0538]|uniref:hypothetical protein n=1 Tax=Solibacillus sp. FSL H8-0538 TaxID=2921400 RepID=UPI0030F69BF6
MNNYNKESTQFLSASELALLAAAVTTIGDGLAVIAAALALQEESQQQEQQPAPTDLKKMQKQIDALSYEIKQLKRQR